MNKKLFFGLFVATSMLFATSCSNDELTQVQSGEYAEVSISLGVEEVAGSRAISDGSGADELYYAVFNSTGQRISTIAQVHKTGVTFPTTETITLAKGQTYKVAFWAQDDDCTAYIVSDDMNVTVNYAGINNDETRDAFFKTVEFTVNGSTSLDVELKRPFAQINVGVETTDWNAAVASGITIKESNVTIKQAASSIDLVTGKVSTPVDVTYTTAAIPTEMLKANNGTYNWLSMSYILVFDGAESTDGAQDATLTSLEYTFSPESGKGNPITFSEGLNNVPVKRNWRTNILGKILTGDIQFNISIDPIYDGEYTYPDGSLEQQLEFAATFGGEVTLTDNVTLTENLVVAKDMKLNLNGFTLTGGKPYSAGMTGTDISALTVDNGANLVVSGEGTIDGTEYGIYVKNGTATIKVGSIKAGTSAVQVYNGTANIEGGNFSTTGTDKRYVINCIDSSWKNGSAKVNITGGTFEEFDPANNAAEGTGTNFCAEGYKSAKVGDNYMVVTQKTSVVSTSADLISAFENGGQVILADDIELNAVLTVKAGAEVYLDMNGKIMTVAKDVDPAFYTYKGSTLVIDGNGTVELTDPALSLVIPGGDVVIENGTFVRTVPEGTPANQVGALFVGMKVSPWGSQTVTINGGYFDGGYYNADAVDIEEILAGTKTFEETNDDIAKRGNSKDANKLRVALKQNVQFLLNLSSNLFKIYGGTFVGANPAWGDEGCMLPTTPNYLRPWSYYQGALLDGQTFNENGIVLPEGYAITKGNLEDGRPTYTVTYNK